MNYGGLPSDGGFGRIREFGVGLATAFEAAHCVLGSLGRHLGKDSNDWSSMIRTETGHLNEEVEIIRKTLREYSRPIYREQMLLADLDSYFPKYREMVKDSTRRQVEDIREAGAKLASTARTLGRQFAENLRDEGAPSPWVNLSAATYLFVMSLADAAVESVANWPDEVGDPFSDPKVIKYIRLMEKHLRALLAWTPDRAANRKRAMNRRHAGAREWLRWIVQPLSTLTKKYKGLVFGPLDDLMDEVFRDLAPKMVVALGEQEIDEDVDEFIDGAREGRFEALDGLYRDPESGQSDDYYLGYEWGFVHAQEWDGKSLPAQVRREVVKDQIEEFRKEVTEQVVIAALEGVWSAVNPREIFKTVMRAVKQHGWKIGLVYAVGEMIENIVLPAALTKITGVPVPPGSLAWLPLNDIVFAVVVKRLGGTDAVDEFEPDGHLDWYVAQYGAVRLASASSHRVARRYAFVSNPVVYLRNYLNMDEYGKGIDLIHNFGYVFAEWLEKWLEVSEHDDTSNPEIQNTIENRRRFRF